MTETTVSNPPDGDLRLLPDLGSEKGMVSTADTGAVAAMARERFEIEAAIIVSRRFPRSEPGARLAILAACARPTVAANALYEFPRGNEMVVGANVRLSREMARNWGNLRSGYRVMATDIERQEAHIAGFAFDLQTNTYRVEETRVRTRVYRRSSGWIDLLGDDALGGDTERQLAELVGRAGAKLERNCTLRILPADLVDEAVEAVKIAQASGVDPEDLRKVVRYFGSKGVTTEQIERVIDREIRTATAEDIAALRRIASTIKSGEATIFEVFGSTKEPELEDPIRPEGKPTGEIVEKPGTATEGGEAIVVVEETLVGADDAPEDSPDLGTVATPPGPIWTIHRTAKNAPMSRRCEDGDQWVCAKYPDRKAVWDGKKWETWPASDPKGQEKADERSRELLLVPEEDDDTQAAPDGFDALPDETPEPEANEPAEADATQAGPNLDDEVFAEIAPEPGFEAQIWINTGNGKVYRHDGATFVRDGAAETEIGARLAREVGELAQIAKMTKQKFLDYCERVVGIKPVGIIDIPLPELERIRIDLQKVTA
jgi:hypothetical protein